MRKSAIGVFISKRRKQHKIRVADRRYVRRGRELRIPVKLIICSGPRIRIGDQLRPEYAGVSTSQILILLHAYFHWYYLACHGRGRDAVGQHRHWLQ